MVLNVTSEVEIGKVFIFAILPQSNVAIDTIIITATSDAIGMIEIISLIKTTIIKRAIPATKVESLPLPPDFTLMTDCPIIAHPAMPPIHPLAILAIP